MINPGRRRLRADRRHHDRERRPGKASRPFDRRRDGFCSAGAAFLSWSRWKARAPAAPTCTRRSPATALVRCLRDQRAPPEGRGAFQAMSRALAGPGRAAEIDASTRTGRRRPERSVGRWPSSACSARRARGPGLRDEVNDPTSFRRRGRRRQWRHPGPGRRIDCIHDQPRRPIRLRPRLCPGSVRIHRQRTCSPARSRSEGRTPRYPRSPMLEGSGSWSPGPRGIRRAMRWPVRGQAPRQRPLPSLGGGARWWPRRRAAGPDPVRRAGRGGDRRRRRGLSRSAGTDRRLGQRAGQPSGPSARHRGRGSASRWSQPARPAPLRACGPPSMIERRLG